MKCAIQTLVLIALLALPYGAGLAGPGQLSPLEISVPHRAGPFESPTGAGTRYEVHVTNLSSTPIDIQRLSIRDATTNELVAVYEGDRLQTYAWRIGGGTSELPPGEHMVIFVELDDAGHRSLQHEVQYAEGTASSLVRSTVVSPGTHKSLTLGPPLRGGKWVAVYDTMLARGHRRVLYSVDGVARIPGRFAIDWMRPAVVAANQGDDEVLAVAEGVVAAMRNDMPDAATRHSKIPLEDGAGNFVSIDIGEGRFAFYEHLKANVRVKLGQRVRRGEVIGHVGASGHALRPHLHFHIADANSALGAEGQPFAIQGMRVLGAYSSIGEFDEGSAWLQWSPSSMGYPPPMAVVEFPD